MSARCSGALGTKEPVRGPRHQVRSVAVNILTATRAYICLICRTRGDHNVFLAARPALSASTRRVLQPLNVELRVRLSVGTLS